MTVDQAILPVSMQTYPDQKIFCIGLNKTGTTSIGDALAILGFRRLGWRAGTSGPLTMRWHEGKIDPFIKVARTYDAFEDLPWPLVYREMSEIFPNSRFILTIRKDDATWLNSIQKHIGRGSNWVGHYLVYGSYDPKTNASAYAERYLQHNADVESYFRDKPGKLLTINIEEGANWGPLCKFLDIAQIPQQHFPHSNTAADHQALMDAERRKQAEKEQSSA